MKKNIKYILFSFLLLMGSACSEDFIDLAPQSQANVNNYYKTPKDITQAVNAAYAALRLEGQYGWYFIFGESTSDNTQAPLSGSVTDFDEFDKFYVRSTNPRLSEMWQHSYIGIFRCNVVLNRIGGVEMSDALENQHIGEVKFLRALMYFNLVRVFGGVPLVLNEIQDVNEGRTHTRASVDEIYNQITTDLQEAEQLLPASYTGSDIGRATRGAAKALLAKVYLTRENYQQAKTKLEEVMALGYELLTDYADIFDPSNANHQESIFEVQYKKGGLGTGSPFANRFAPEFSANNVVPVGGTGGHHIVTEDLLNAYEEGDLRKEASIREGYLNQNQQFVPVRYTIKFMDVPFQNNDADNNWPVLRYADVLLMYAEVLNELNYGQEAAFDALNAVRERAGLEGYDATDLPDQQSFRLAVEKERRVELAFEGHRWFDLVRTDRALPVINAHLAPLNFQLEPYQLIFPIPQSQIDVNPGNIDQNPGHNL